MPKASKTVPEDTQKDIAPGRYSVCQRSRQYKHVYRHWTYDPKTKTFKTPRSAYTIERRGEGTRPWRVCFHGAVLMQGKGNAEPFHSYKLPEMAAWAIDNQEAQWPAETAGDSKAA